MLNFDPHRWLAETETVAAVADVARADALRESVRTTHTPATVATLATDPSRELRTWHQQLSGLDENSAPTGIAANTWFQLCLDSWWLYETHASYAIRHGWDRHGLFGVMTDYPLGGGLAQQLRSSRSLLWDGEIATFRLLGVASRRHPKLAANAPLIWQLNR